MTNPKEEELIRLRTELDKYKLEQDGLDKTLHVLQNSQAIFLRKLSQNICIPIDGISGIIEVLKVTNIDDDQNDYLGLIANYGNNLQKIISDMMDYANLMNNSLQLNADYFEIGKLAEEIQDLLSNRIEGKGLKLVLNIDEQIPTFLYGDQLRIKQILINILNNAIQHTSNGEICLTIEQLYQENLKTDLLFSVKDTGKGMQQSLIQTLKQDLNSNDITTRLSLNGVGVGLAITQTLLKRMESYLSFESKLNEGSHFWFTISIPTRHKNRSGVFNENNPGQRTLKILLVEDNLLNQKFAKITLTKQGHFLDIAENGKVAIEKFKSDTYDLILMDVQMPIMNGIEATRQIRKLETELKLERVRIIAVTAFDLDNKREECIEAGMDGFLPKPFKPNQIIRLIDEIKFP